MATTDKPEVPTARTHQSPSGQFDMTTPNEEVVDDDSLAAS